MNEELLTQLREILQKNGVEEEKIEATIEELAGEPEKEEPVEEIVEEEHEEPVEEVVDEMPVDPVEEEAVVDEVATKPTEVVEEPVVEQPAIDEELKARLDEAWGEIEEMKKANEGLLARISALEEALANAGVIDKTLTTSNDTLGRTEEAPSNEDLGNPMDNFLAKVRGNKRY